MNTSFSYLNRAWVATLLLAGTFSGLQAQQAGMRSGYGYFQVGFHQLDLDGLNQQLRDRGIPAFQNGFVTLGGGGHAEIRRLLLGGEGQALIEQSETAGSYQRKLSGGMGFFDMGLVLARPDRARAYAMIGLGFGGINLRTTERQLPSFEQVLDEPRRGSDVASGGFLTQLSLGGDILLHRTGSPGVSRGLNLGARVGYVFAPWVSEWRVNGAEAPGGPEVGLDGLYVRFSIGGGGTRPRGTRVAGG
jgi:hypothetical protein